MNTKRDPVVHKYDLDLLERWRQEHPGAGALKAFAARHSLAVRTVYNYVYWVTSGQRDGTPHPVLSEPIREGLRSECT